MKELHHHHCQQPHHHIIARDGSMIMWTVGRLLGVGPSANKGQCQYNLIVYRLCHHLHNHKHQWKKCCLVLRRQDEDDDDGDDHGDLDDYIGGMIVMMVMMMMMTGSWSGGFHIARQPPTAANLNIQSSISLSIDIVDILLKFEYPIFAGYTQYSQAAGAIQLFDKGNSIPDLRTSSKKSNTNAKSKISRGELWFLPLL